MQPLSIEENGVLFRAIYVRAIRELIPGLSVLPKYYCPLHIIINTIFNLFLPKSQRDHYLDKVSTTVGYTIAMASVYRRPYTEWEILCHELMHALDGKKWTRFLMGFLYLWPLSQGALLLLTCWLPVFWASGWTLACWIGCWVIIALLHFIPQLPDPWRHCWEIKAYSVSMYLYYMIHDNIAHNYVTHIVNNLHSMNYYITSNNRQKTYRQLRDIAMSIMIGTSGLQNNPVIKIASEEYAKVIAARN